MLISAVAIMSIVVIYLLKNIHNKFTNIIALYFFSIASLIIVSILYISKISTYTFPLYVDRYMYIWLSKIKIHVEYISRLYNLCISLFLFTSVLFYKFFKNSKWWLLIILSLPIAYFFIVNDPTTTWLMFYYSYSDEIQIRQMVTAFVPIFKSLNTIIIIFYMLIPIFALFTYYKSTKIKMQKKHTIIFIVSLAIIDLLMYFIAINGFFSAINYNNIDLTKFPVTNFIQSGYILPPLLVFFTVLSIIFLTLYYKPFVSISTISHREMIKNTKLLNSNLNMILHAYKNAFIGVNRLSNVLKTSLEENEIDKVSICADTIQTISAENIEAITKVLNLLKNIDMIYSNINVSECIDHALNTVCIPKNIKVDKSCLLDKLFILGDINHITECFVNIFQNSIYALQKKAHKDPCITISTEVEDNFCIIRITDNGCGIKKSDIKHIFKPFYSTKSRVSSGGVGLSFVHEVSKAHHGDIEVESVENEYTTFSIILHLVSKKKYKGGAALCI